MDFGLDEPKRKKTKNNNENNNWLYTAKVLETHEPIDSSLTGFKLRRFTLVSCTRGDRGYYILVNIVPQEVQIDGITSYYQFEGIRVFPGDLDAIMFTIKKESILHVLDQLKTKIEPLVYYEEVGLNESQEHKVTEKDVHVISYQIGRMMHDFDWMSQFDEKDVDRIEEKINKIIELFKEREEEQKKVQESLKMTGVKLYESDIKF